jgi:hypothetical protein
MGKSVRLCKISTTAQDCGHSLELRGVGCMKDVNIEELVKLYEQIASKKGPCLDQRRLDKNFVGSLIPAAY